MLDYNELHEIYNTQFVMSDLIRNPETPGYWIPAKNMPE